MNNIIAAGALFAILAFIHMFADLFTQTEKMAMIKHDNHKIRAIHCALYSACFLPIFLVAGTPIVETVAGLFFLFASHFIGDTYLPSYVWARFVRRPPEMNVPDKLIGFKRYCSTSLGKALVIWVDQIYHLACLWYVVHLLRGG